MFQPLPPGVHVYKTTDPLDGKPNVAYYVEANLKNKKLKFTVDTTYKRRLTPSQFYEKNDKPLLVVNTTFFSFTTHQNLNVVIKNKKLVSHNIHTIPAKGDDTLTYLHVFGSAIGISQKRKADVAWIYTDPALRMPRASQTVIPVIKDSIQKPSKKYLLRKSRTEHRIVFKKWKMKSAVGGGPVLIQNGEIKITNNEELKFAGKAIDDKHPRTAMGYTINHRLIILVIEGRNSGIAEGAGLPHVAQILKDLGCQEALNLDGGGSSCMLVNGKETIKVSDLSGQRPVPAVFIIQKRR